MLALISQTPLAPAASPANVIDLQLPAKPIPPRAAEPPPQGMNRRALTAPPTRAPAPPLNLVASPPSANPSLPAPIPDDERLRRALNAALGCDLPGGPSPDDRLHCAERFATAGGPPTRSFDIDPAQRADFDASAERARWWQKPFLATDAKNGCRPKVTNQQAGIPGGRGAISDWRVSMGCAVAF